MTLCPSKAAYLAGIVLNHDHSTNSIAPYEGCITRAFDCPEIRLQLASIRQLIISDSVQRLSRGPDYVVKLQLDSPQGPISAAVKIFKRQHRLKDWYDRRHKSKAERSYLAAIHLQRAGIDTPAPIAWLEKWEQHRLVESYYICRYEPAICLRDALAKIYREDRNNEPLMALLHVVAPAVRAMHDAGFMHGDLGNQNILIPLNKAGQWAVPQFIDLNRSRVQSSPLDDKQRAFDISRIALPGAYLKIFKMIYCDHQEIPKEFDRREAGYRRSFERHRASRKLRHPIRYWKKRHEKPDHPTYPPPRDIWLWDEKSAQPMIILGRKEKHRYRHFGYMLLMLWQSLIAAPGIFRRYRKLLQKNFTQSVTLAGRIGVALHPKPGYIEQELSLLQELGNPPVLLRFYHHEDHAEWERGIELANHLHQQGIDVMIALLQDRQAVLHPEKWSRFLHIIIEALADKVAHIEISHASNRLKWGVWNADEYRTLLEPALVLQQRFPNIKLTGPACIDFEYMPVVAALKALPGSTKLAALSHLLYVDRRGAPEGKQGSFSTLEKCALLKALAQWSDSCEDKVIISEVNWPIKHTGIWSPIGCPYETPKWKQEQPGETEDDYANYMLRYLLITLCSGHIERVFWWRLSAHGYGLIDDLDNFRRRPAFQALKVLLDFLRNARFMGKLDSPSGSHAFEFKDSHKTIVVAWHEREDEQLTALNRGDFDYACDRNGQKIEEVILSPSPVYLISNIS